MWDDSICQKSHKQSEQAVWIIVVCGMTVSARKLPKAYTLSCPPYNPVVCHKQSKQVLWIIVVCGMTVIARKLPKAYAPSCPPYDSATTSALHTVGITPN
jgi:hypothetical protein